MWIILHEGIPRQLVGALRAAGLNADPFDKAWAGPRNGQPIKVVEAAGYDLLLINDKSIAARQSLAERLLAIVAPPFHRRRDILEHVDEIVKAIRQASPGQHPAMISDRERGKITG